MGGGELQTPCRLLGSALEKPKQKGETTPGSNQGECYPPFDWSQPTDLAVAKSYLRMTTEEKESPSLSPIPPPQDSDSDCFPAFALVVQSASSLHVLSCDRNSQLLQQSQLVAGS